MLLESLKDLARRAFHGTSMDPERRGAQYLAGYEEQLLEDLKQLPEGDHAQYISRYISYLGSYFHSESRCVSSWIAGPSNFPVRQQEKYRGWAQNKLQAFDQWRQRALKGIERRERRLARQNGPSPFVLANEHLMKLKQRQEYMKRVNALHKKFLKDPTVIDGEDEKTQALIRNYKPDYSWNPHPYPGYALTNNGAEIRRMEKRVQELASKEAQIEAQKGGEEERYEFPGGHVLINYEADRIQIFHDEKPAPQVIAAMKQAALKWAPSMKCWQRQLTGNARWSIGRLLGLDLSEKAKNVL